MAAANASVQTLSVIASGAVTAKRFCSPTGAIASAAGNAIGVFLTDQDSGKAVAVESLGTTIVTSGGALAAGAAVEVGASGKAVTKASGIAVARLAPGASATGADQDVEVILIPN